MKNNKSAAKANATIALNSGARTAIISDLNGALAHALDLSFAAKQAHWNVRGANFQGLHELFDKIACAARDAADELAERAVTLGGVAHGTVQDATGNTTLSPFPNNSTDWTTLTRALHAHVLRCANLLRESLQIVGDDPITEDMYIGIIAELEKYGWMLDAHL